MNPFSYSRTAAMLRPLAVLLLLLALGGCQSARVAMDDDDVRGMLGSGGRSAPVHG